MTDELKILIKCKDQEIELRVNDIFHINSLYDSHNRHSTIIAKQREGKDLKFINTYQGTDVDYSEYGMYDVDKIIELSGKEEVRYLGNLDDYVKSYNDTSRLYKTNLYFPIGMRCESYWIKKKDNILDLSSIEYKIDSALKSLPCQRRELAEKEANLLGVKNLLESKKLIEDHINLLVRLLRDQRY